VKYRPNAEVGFYQAHQRRRLAGSSEKLSPGYTVSIGWDNFTPRRYQDEGIQKPFFAIFRLDGGRSPF
jgi:maltose/maltodextrin transport system permease protein